MAEYILRKPLNPVELSAKLGVPIYEMKIVESTGEITIKTKTALSAADKAKLESIYQMSAEVKE